MNAYDSERLPDFREWLDLEDEQRVERVVSFHQGSGVEIPNVRLHAAIHVVVENQIAVGEPVVTETIGRLQREGLSRHEAVHAVGSVAAEHLRDVLRGDRPAEGTERRRPYSERVKALTAAGWRATR